MHEEFLSEVTRGLTRELAPKCECPGAPERKVTSLVVLASINGQPYVWDASIGDPDLTPASPAVMEAATHS